MRQFNLSRLADYERSIEIAEDCEIPSEIADDRTVTVGNDQLHLFECSCREVVYLKPNNGDILFRTDHGLEETLTLLQSYFPTLYTDYFEPSYPTEVCKNTKAKRYTKQL